MNALTETIEKYVDGELVETTVLNLTTEDVLQLETEKYLRRKLDGEKMFLTFAAELRLAKLSEAIDSQTFDVIEDLLVPVRNEVVLGQWKTALRKLQEINPTSIGNELYAKIETTISDYILINY